VIEVVLVIAIIGTVLVTLLGLASFSLRSSNLLKESSKADSLSQEAIEAVRNFRDGTTWSTDGLGTLSLGVSYHPQEVASISPNPPKWSLVAGEESVGIFTRKIVIEKVFRDANGNISGSGTEDSNTKKIAVTVSWKNRKVEIIDYLTNWK